MENKCIIQDQDGCTLTNKKKKTKMFKSWGQFLEKLAVKSVNYRFI